MTATDDGEHMAAWTAWTAWNCGGLGKLRMRHRSVKGARMHEHLPYRVNYDHVRLHSRSLRPVMDWMVMFLYN